MPMRDDYAISADLCEEHGLVESAAVLRQVAGGTCEVFMVRPEGFYEDWPGTFGSSPGSTVLARRMFRTREEAERHAVSLKAAALRGYSFHDNSRPYLFTVPEAEFCRRVTAVLKANYRLPAELPTPLLPATASDAQLIEIAPLIRENFFEVVRVPIDPGEEPLSDG